MYPTAITSAAYTVKTRTFRGRTQYRCRGARGFTISELCADFLARNEEWSTCTPHAGKLVLAMDAAATAAAVSRLEELLSNGYEIVRY